MIAVIAKLPVKPEVKDDAIAEMKGLIAKVAEEEGTLHYTLNIDQNNPDVLVVIERYTDMEALGLHSSTPHFQEFMGKAGDFLAGPPEIITLEELHSI